MTKAKSISPGLAFSWFLAVTVIVVGLVVGTVASSPATPLERARDLAGRFGCPVCNGQSVRESDSGIAIEIRAEIQRQVQAGRSDSEILGYLENSYPGHLLTPPATGVSALVWVLPVTLGIAAMAAAGFAFILWRPRHDVVVPPEDQALVDRLLEARRAGSGEQ